MTKPRILLIRADAGPDIGSGHVMRCFALAEAWVDSGGEVRFVSKTSSPQLDARLRELGPVIAPAGTAGSAEDARGTAAEAVRAEAAWVVVDGYTFNDAFEVRVAESGSSVLTIDDLGTRSSFGGHAVLNQNAYAQESFYSGAARSPLLLLGSRYVLLRREFRQKRLSTRPCPRRASRLLISIGGGDSHGVSEKVIEALRLLKPEDLELTLLVGSNNPRFSRLEGLAASLGFPSRVIVGTRDVAGWMAWADVAVQGGGSTVWESCCMGLPSLVVCVAENQRKVVEFVEAQGVGESLGWHDCLALESVSSRLEAMMADQERRSSISRAGMALVDGLGAPRVRDALLERAR